MATGVYKIVCSKSSDVYVGSAEDIDLRWKSHWKQLTEKKHKNKALQFLWDMHGAAAFSCETVETADAAQLKEREQHYLDVLKPALNVMKTSGKRDGRLSKLVQMGVRIDEDVLRKLKTASYLFRKPKKDIVQEALLEYFDKRDLSSEYQLHVSKDSMILMQLVANKHPIVVEVVKRNGVSPEDVAKKYGAELLRPVSVIWAQSP